MRYAEPTEDPFADSESSSEDPTEDDSDGYIDTDYSELEYSEISGNVSTACDHAL